MTCSRLLPSLAIALSAYWITAPLATAQLMPPLVSPTPPTETDRPAASPVPVGPVMPSAAGTRPETATESLFSQAYTLAVGDRLFVGIANVPEFSAQYQVQVDGSIHLPVLGNVSVWGMTLQEAAQDITRRYTQAKILNDPTITVSLLAGAPLKIAVTGAVNRPGAYNLPLVDGKLPTITEAIQKAGGMTEMADLRQVQVLRPQRLGGDRTLQVNLMALLQTGDLRQDIPLRSGDSIVLPTAKAIDPAEASLLGSANVSPDAIQVGILGEVRASGAIQVPPNTPLNQALLAAGGFTNRARKSSVELIRLNPNGTVTRRRIAVDLSKGVNDQTNPILRNRDVIVVGRSTLAAIGDTLGTILTPVGQAFSLFNLFQVLFPKSN